MAINVSVQHNERWVSPRCFTATGDPMILPSGNPFKCHEEVLYMQPMIPPTKRFDIFSPLGNAQKVQMRSDFSLNSEQKARHTQSTSA